MEGVLTLLEIQLNKVGFNIKTLSLYLKKETFYVLVKSTCVYRMWNKIS